MAGLYLHIPYCHRACTYCNFHFSTNLETKDRVLKAMQKELHYYSTIFSKKIKTIYFGGGTPSILSIHDFQVLMNSIESNFDISSLEEFTLECNPEDLQVEKMRVWKSKGVNRLSIGVQSFQNDILKTINRQHTKELALENIKWAQTIFKHISIDLIVGLPGLDQKKLKEDLKIVLALDPDHISAYQLSLEAKTALAHDVKRGRVKLMDDEAINDQYRTLATVLSENKYIHYEVSNYAKKGKEALHNSSYWNGDPYLGIGPGAHSFVGNERRWNISNNIQYAQKLEHELLWYENEELSNKDQFNEKIMISLRTNKGLSLSYLKDNFPPLFTKDLIQKVKLWEQNGWANTKENTVYLSIEGWLISDQLASDLFVI